MPRGRPKKITVKKTTKAKVTQDKMPTEYKQWIIAVIFVLVGILALIADTNSVFWYTLFSWGNYAFWELYKFIFAPVLFVLVFFMFWENKIPFNLYRFLGLLFYYMWFTTLIGYFASNYYWLFNIWSDLQYYLGSMATFFVALVLFILSLVMLFRFSPIVFIKNFLGWSWKIAWTVLDKTFSHNSDDELEENNSTKTSWKRVQVNRKKSRQESTLDKKKEELSQMLAELKEEKKNLNKQEKEPQLQLKSQPQKIQIEKKVPEKIKNYLEKKEWKNRESDSNDTWIIQKEFKNWEFPSLDLLDNKWWDIVYDKNEIRQKELEIQEKLLQFNIDVTMEGYNVWPTVIQYRLKPRAWVKLQQIVNLKQDLTLALHAKNIRIQAPIPGQWVVWIEAPNPNRQVVGLKEILNSRAFNNKKLKIPLALWKNVNGDFIVGDLTKMPHMLVAGQTASWKSVWVNAFLISMLYKFSPSELKLILIDPKIVELSVYNWIPHLLTPVITQPSKALNSLKWCVAEMLRRYDLARQVWARNLDEYNAKKSKKERLPYIVIVLDELADLMLSWDKKEVEWNITRIAQMARAVWMHLIIATQRPSVNIITWVIKANVPSRIAFTVSSQIDSQTILWKKWAEDLLGMWDMLYYPTGQLEPERVQWVFVETHEVESVITKLKLTVDPDMIKNMQDDSIVNGKSKTEWSILENYNWDQDEDPAIIEKAMLVVKEAKKWSTSLVQRKLWLGYARAAKVLDILEELWVVWPANWSKPRDVYVD